MLEGFMLEDLVLKKRRKIIGNHVKTHMAHRGIRVSDVNGQIAERIGDISDNTATVYITWLRKGHIYLQNTVVARDPKKTFENLANIFHVLEVRDYKDYDALMYHIFLYDDRFKDYWQL